MILGGSLQVNGKTITGKGSLFLVNKPSPGVWKLAVPPSAGGHFITARAVSEENIDFEFFFIVETKVGRTAKPITVNAPLKGNSSLFSSQFREQSFLILGTRTEDNFI